MRKYIFITITLTVIGVGFLSVFSQLQQKVEDVFSVPKAEAATESIAKVKQSCAGETAPCYTSLAAWEAAYGGITFGACAQGDLVCADKIVVAEIDGAWTQPDTTAVTINGWTTDATHYIKIYTTLNYETPLIP